MERAIGDFVIEATPLASVAGKTPDDEITRKVNAAYMIGRDRTVHQDAAYGARPSGTSGRHIRAGGRRGPIGESNMNDPIRLVGTEEAIEVFGVRLVGANAESGRKLLFTLVFIRDAPTWAAVASRGALPLAGPEP
jgi:hypothetical protein